MSRWVSLDGIRDKRVYIRTFGCTYNHGDTRKMVDVLVSQGCLFVDSPGEADTVIINSCTVVDSTARKVLKCIREFRDRDLYVTGCMPPVSESRILEICNPQFIHPDSVREASRRSGSYKGYPTAIVQIAQGCAGQCTYCITRHARGPLISFPAEEILGQVERSVAGGATEVQITAQDVSAYGMDTGHNLPGLLSDITGIDGVFRIRIGMMNPSTLKKIIRPLSEILQHEKIFRFIHMPVQSGSDPVLSRMGRGYTTAECSGIVRAVRKITPDLQLMTDMIVGFPGETERDFQCSLSLIRDLEPNKVNITRFSKRPGTDLSNTSDFPDHLKKTRSRRMNSLCEDMYHTLNARVIGKVVPFIVTEKIRPGSAVARSPTYQGIVIREDLPVGTTGNAELVGEKTYYFIGNRQQE